MNLLKYSKLAGILALLIYSTLQSACKKEYEQTPYNYTDILSFSYTDTAGNLQKAAIRGDSIVIYWPDRLTESLTITPAIVVAEKATVNPASGTPIELASGTPITVTAEDGSTKTYYIKLVQNLPEIIFTTSAVTGELPITLKRGTTIYAGLDSGINRPDVGTFIFYKNIYPNAPDTKFSLIDADDKEIPLDFTITPQYTAGFTLGYDIDTGRYRMKVVNAGRTKISNTQNIIVQYNQQIYGTINADIEVARGGTFTIPGTFDQDFSKIVSKLKLVKIQFGHVHTTPPDTYASVLSIDTLSYEFPFVSHTETTATFRVPTDIPDMDYFCGWHFPNTTETDPWTVGFWDGTADLGVSVTSRNVQASPGTRIIIKN